MTRITPKRNGIAPLTLVLVIGLLGVGVIAAAKWIQADEQAGEWTVLKVYDGDTVLVARDGARRLVRLLGIDAPETSKGHGKPGQPYSRKSKEYLASMVLNRSVTLAIFGEDRYQRLLAVLYCDDEDINRAMIQAGLAEVYRGRTPDEFDKTPYLVSEAQARQARAGMWRQGSDYISPLRWKHPP